MAAPACPDLDYEGFYVLNNSMDEILNPISRRFSDAEELASDAYEKAVEAIGSLGDEALSFSPETPSITLDNPPSTSATKPTAPDMPEADFSAITSDLKKPMVPHSLRDGALTLVTGWLTEGGPGLTPEVEEAIWDQAKNRMEVADKQRYDDVSAFWASRGFDMPTGAMNAQLDALRDEIARRESDLNRDILIQSSDLAQKNTHFAVDAGLRWQEYIRNEEMSYVTDIDIPKARMELDAELALLEEGKMDLEKFRALTDAYIAEINSQTQAYLGGAEVQAAQIDAEVKIEDMKLRAEIAKAELSITAQKAVADVAAGLASSAMMSVNASMSAGWNGSRNVGYSFGQSETISQSKGCSISHTYFHEDDGTVDSAYA